MQPLLALLGTGPKQRHLLLDDVGKVDCIQRQATILHLPTRFTAASAGDRILTVNGDEVDLATFELTEPALILVQAPGGVTRHLRLDPWTPSDGVRPVGGANVLDPAVVVF